GRPGAGGDGHRDEVRRPRPHPRRDRSIGGDAMKAGISIRVVAILIAVFLVLPTIIVVATSFTEARIITFPPKGFSFQWFEEVLTSRRWMGALQNSLI